MFIEIFGMFINVNHILMMQADVKNEDHTRIEWTTGGYLVLTCKIAYLKDKINALNV